jgi:hypothetical protein
MIVQGAPIVVNGAEECPSQGCSPVRGAEIVLE